MKYSIRFAVLILILLVSVSINAEDVGEEEFLPIGLTAEELLRLDEIGINHIRTTPPPGPIRNCAEWEPSVGVIIRWPLGLSYAIIAEFSEDLMVTTLVGSTSQMNSAKSVYTANGVNMDNTQFIIAATNSIWTRDYGPWFIFDGTGDLAITDHIYNRPRPYDDQIPWILGSEWGMTVYGMDLIATGGNHMSDGLGISMSTELIYNENPSLTEKQVDSIMLEFTGNAYHVLDYIDYGGIHHIDCWAKFLSPAKILIKDVSPGDYSYSLLNDRAEALAQMNSSWDRPYEIARVYCPSGAAYTNSIILGTKVFVPILGYSDWDDSAIAVYQDAMPGYEVLGFTGSFYDDDAIHCRAMGVPDTEMLFISHIPLKNSVDTANDYQVGVRIVDHSNAGLIPDSLVIFYSINGGLFTPAQLYPTANPDSFYGYIPAQPDETEIEYYIRASDSSGRTETHPFIGRAWAHSFFVDYNSPPIILVDDTLFCKVSESFAYYPEIVDDDSTHLIGYSDYPGWLVEQNDSLIGTSQDIRTLDSFTVRVEDEFNYDEREIFVMAYKCGDVNADDVINIFDVTSLIGYLYHDGVEPYPLFSADINNDTLVNIFDITGLISYLYQGGDEPNCP
jgi:agmatine/peptidylarginine deiminase